LLLTYRSRSELAHMHVLAVQDGWLLQDVRTGGARRMQGRQRSLALHRELLLLLVRQCDALHRPAPTTEDGHKPWPHTSSSVTCPQIRAVYVHEPGRHRRRPGARASAYAGKD